MSSTLILVLASMLLFFLIFMGLWLFRERVRLQLQEDALLIQSPFRTRKVVLGSALKSWKVQQATYLRWGVVYSLNMLFADGRRLGVNSRFTPENFEQLYTHLNSRYATLREPDDGTTGYS